MLFAERDGLALALACSAPWRQCSAGFVGFSDGWQDLSKHKKLTWNYLRAAHGNVALVSEVDLSDQDNGFTFAIGFGLNSAEAGLRALSSLQEGYPSICQAYVDEWASWQEKVKIPSGGTSTKKQNQLFRTSATVLRSHEAKRFPGGLIASLSFPWGFAKGDDDLGGYHLVWPRDLVEAAGGLLAIGAQEDARRVLQYLRVTQEAEGNWPQNMWLDGRAFWNGIQMDETALPILLVDLARREGALSAQQTRDLWPMVHRAAGFLVRNGPVSPQDRWEEDPGYSPFTLAVEITALLAAADMAELHKEPQIAAYLRQTADTWNDNIERWTYISGSDLAKQVGVSGYYVRIAPPDVASSASLAEGFVPIKNRPPGESEQPASQIVSTDALALVRFGLRSPQDERILNTIKVIDASLKEETPNGPAWHRYTDDGYGEKADGDPFGGEPAAGIGRPWPLLTGERAHYELAAGNKSTARELQDALAAFSNKGGMLAEQIWDSEDIPEKELFCGKPSGSAMPLVWTHAEYVKLCRSLSDGQVFDMPAQAVQRYLKKKTVSDFVNWDFNQKIRSIPEGKKLRLETLEPARIRWSADHWETAHDQPTQDTGLGIYYSDLPTDDLSPDAAIEFTFYWQANENWEDKEYSVSIEEKQHDKK